METKLEEATFGLDDFKKPNVLYDEEAIARTILMILFGRPGCFPSLPEIGMNISKYFYTFSDEIDPTDIKVQLSYQCSLVTELIDEGTLDVKKSEYDGKTALTIIIPSISSDNDNILVIGVTTNYDGSVIYNYDIMRSDFAEFF